MKTIRKKINKFLLLHLVFINILILNIKVDINLTKEKKYEKNRKIQ